MIMISHFHNISRHSQCPDGSRFGILLVAVQQRYFVRWETMRIYMTRIELGFGEKQNEWKVTIVLVSLVVAVQQQFFARCETMLINRYRNECSSSERETSGSLFIQ
jgi:hypothetical protein